jgi:polysaccharide biosynthesis protein PslH
VKILFVTPYLPGPPVFGGQRRTHGLMTALAREHEVSLVALVDGHRDLSAGLADAHGFCKQVVVVEDQLRHASGLQKRVMQLGSILSRHSWEQLQHLRPALQRALDTHLAQHHYDAINVEFCFMGGYRFPVPRQGPTRTALVLDEHNVEYDILRRTARATRFDRRVYNAVNYPKLEREELRAWRKFDGTVFTSERDARVAAEALPGLRSEVIPNGVDVDTFRPHEGDLEAPQTLLFFGAINYFPNTDALQFFVRQVLPLVLRSHPNAVLRIVGPGVPPEIAALASGHVQVVGFVDDLRTEIARATVVLAPLRIGGGTRLKIIEAMGVGRPVVATSLGAEGIDVRNEHDVLIADEPEALASAIGRLLDDPSLRRKLGSAARDTALARYSWSEAARKLAHFYAHVQGSVADGVTNTAKAASASRG